MSAATASCGPSTFIASAASVIVAKKTSQSGHLPSTFVTAIIHWNTIYTCRVVKALYRAGQQVPDQLLSSLSPLTWEHVNLTGDYIWEDKPALDDSGFRPLPFSI